MPHASTCSACSALLAEEAEEAPGEDMERIWRGGLEERCTWGEVEGGCIWTWTWRGYAEEARLERRCPTRSEPFRQWRSAVHRAEPQLLQQRCLVRPRWTRPRRRRQHAKQEAVRGEEAALWPVLPSLPSLPPSAAAPSSSSSWPPSSGPTLTLDQPKCVSRSAASRTGLTSALLEASHCIVPATGTNLQKIKAGERTGRTSELSSHRVQFRFGALPYKQVGQRGAADGARP